MGGCRCSYRNCTLRTDGKTHMFHYPVFDKVRCHQWLTNARKLEFLNLKVSQLKNRVVCQHHFKDENFMNFKKDKLTHDAVPTEDGPYCDSSQADVNKTENEDTKVFSISLDDIEDEYLTIVDKKANFSVKYGDFLTNCDLMDLDALNQIDDNNQVDVHTICVFDSHVPKEQVSSNIPVRSITRNMTKRKKNDNANNTILKDNTTRNNTLNQENITTHYISKNNEAQQKIEDQNSTTLTFNISQIPVEFDETKQNTQNEISVELFKTISNAQKPDIPFVFADTISNDHKQQDWQQPQAIDFKKFEQSKPMNENNNKTVLNERKKIRIISEKKQILEPVPVGKLEPVSPNRILTIPIQRKTNPKPLQVIPEVVINSINENPNEPDKFKADFVVQKSERQQIGTNHILSTIEYKKNVSQRNESNVLNKSLNEGSLNTSLMKNKIPPERVAAIAEKRKFNMKLRDIIEDCLDKLDEPDKFDSDKRKTHKSRTVPTKNQKIGPEIKEPELPQVQKYTIAYLEARMKKMENNLLSKIDENSQKIQDLKHTCTIDMKKAVHKKKSVQTQTSVSEDVHKKQLYQELSKYLSQEANSLIYEELFINKFTQQVPMSLSPTKRRKRR